MNLTFKKLILLSVLTVLLGVSMVYALSYWFRPETSNSHAPGNTVEPMISNLFVFAYSGDGFVQASVIVSGPNILFANGVSANVTTINCTTSIDLQNPLRFLVQPGVYSVSGTYDSAPPQNTTVDVTEIGSFGDAILNFGYSSPPPLGHIVISAWYWGTGGGSFVQASVTITGPEHLSGTISASDFNISVFTVQPGVYSVSGTYDSAPQQSITVNVTAGEFAAAPLNFSPSSPPY